MRRWARSTEEIMGKQEKDVTTPFFAEQRRAVGTPPSEVMVLRSKIAN
jgi:hypothetical protein